MRVKSARFSIFVEENSEGCETGNGQASIRERSFVDLL